MLQPADVLLLDEPTNDLDIPTLEILEESLLEFRGSLVLVTHDRYMLDRVSTIVLGLDGLGGAESFADYSQWEVWQAESKQSAKSTARLAPQTATSEGTSSAKTKLSYLEAREYATIEQRVADAEQMLQAKRGQMEDPAIASDGPRLLAAHAEMEEAQNKVDELYGRWSELEKKKN
jgi:ATP-binding cassette subfamily F protein uup